MALRLPWLMVALVCAGCAEGSSYDSDGEDSPATGGNPSNGGGSSDGGAASSGGGTGDGGASADCGNGEIEGDEACDGLDFGAETCVTEGFAGGELACTGSCEIDSSGCLETLCNNGVVDEGEACDGPNLDGATCSGNGFAGGTLTCTSDTCELDTDLCKDPLAEGFESGGLPAGFSSTGDALWLVDTTGYVGTRSARNGDIGDYGISSLNVTVQFDSAGSIAFYHLESTESGYDYLEFYIDGVMQGSWSGTTSWTQASYPVSVGSHQMTWTYSKDVSLSSGSDSVWVDEITAVNGFVP